MGPIDPEAGAVLLVDKPATWTSFNVVAKLRGALHKLCGHRVKVGHAGTLDPLATGLLILGTGRMTKRLPELTAQDKEYIATLRLGQTTASYDAETPVLEERPWEHITTADLQRVLTTFLGDTLQRPPDFSAKRFQGERGYNLVRWGEPVVMTPVPVRIDAIELLALNGPEATLRVACGKGTYIRSLAHDIGQALGCGAWLSGLRRTRSGAYSVDDALTVEQWSDWLDKWAAERQPTDTQKG
ncbi:MAG TPA: tRNA pseudouridine(55) synthase TruB [Flavobacteriales bacterium]|mgnify:FL=1|nr:tRNA pseudouridine(55) synthase TruB [Flavobacteriales bacterium]HNK68834.1 tRNA pseudouridine(55) synthase TruB [Flavobacteriales bacterium]HNK86603.1 tRNA pseudouridine(55) synthase TruB [Flavobacteriales bacterium]